MLFPYTDEQRQYFENIFARPQTWQAEDLDLDLVRSTTITPTELAIVSYFRDVEGFTPYYRDKLISNPAVQEDEYLRHFMTEFWPPEEAEHEKILNLFMANVPVSDEAPSSPIPLDGRSPTRLRPYGHDVPAPSFGQQLASWLGDKMLSRVVPAISRVPKLGEPLEYAMTAAHMTWGWLNEYTTSPGYTALMRRVRHPAIQQIVPMIKPTEHKHIDFYGEQAKIRLAKSPLARKVVFRALRRWHNPVGVDEASPQRFGLVAKEAFGSNDGVEATKKRAQRSLDLVKRVDDELGELLEQPDVNILTDGIQRTIEAYERWAGTIVPRSMAA